MIQLILAALIAIAPSANKAPIIYEEIVKPHVEKKVVTYVNQIKKAHIDIEYLSAKAKLSDYIQSEETDNTYLFYTQIVLEVIHRTEDYEYVGEQGMNMVVIVSDGVIVYSTITKPYWIHKEERRLIKCLRPCSELELQNLLTA